MRPNTTAIERAFELAAQPGVNSISEIRRALAAEGYSAVQIEGPALRRQLRALIDNSKVVQAQDEVPPGGS